MSVTIAGTTLYTLREVSERMSVSVATLRSYIDSGRLEATRVGREYRVTDEALRSFLGLNPAAPADLPSATEEDPILAVIGLGHDGAMSRDTDEELYG